MADETRTAHPFFMYDHMQAQPAAWSDVIARNREAAHDFALEIWRQPRVFLCGIGTSFHAAQTGENIFRAYNGNDRIRAINSFDFALYGPRLTSSDAVVVISHRGTKGYSVQSLQRARDALSHRALITGQGAHLQASRERADFVFPTVAQEQSSAHTFSYTGSVAVMTLLAQELTRLMNDEESLDDELLLTTIPEAIQAALATESDIAPLAREIAKRRRIWIVGGGPAAIVAHETALKIKETSYSQAEGLMTETMIHGPFQCVEADDVFILIAPEGAARSRTMEIAGMIHEIGAPYIVVSDQEQDDDKARAWVRVPHVPEPFSALTCLMPMQLFSYHLALAKGTNPDNFRRDDPHFARASARIKL